MYTRASLHSMSSRDFSAGCYHGARKGLLLPLRVATTHPTHGTVPPDDARPPPTVAAPSSTSPLGGGFLCTPLTASDSVFPPGAAAVRGCPVPGCRSAWEVLGLYRMRADWTISRVAGIEPGARSSHLPIDNPGVWAPARDGCVGHPGGARVTWSGGGAGALPSAPRPG